MTAILKRIAVIVGLIVALIYAGDFLLVEYKVHWGKKPFENVQVENYAAVPEKNNKVEFFFNDPDTEECVHALFPHAGDNPCWYDNRHRDNRTDL
jgi:hypothetical protein